MDEQKYSVELTNYQIYTLKHRFMGRTNEPAIHEALDKAEPVQIIPGEMHASDYRKIFLQLFNTGFHLQSEFDKKSSKIVVRLRTQQASDNEPGMEIQVSRMMRTGYDDLELIYLFEKMLTNYMQKRIEQINSTVRKQI